MSAPTVLVIGGTGAMGAAVVRRLVRTTDSTIRVMTRSPQSPPARALSDLGRGRVVLYRGDLDTPDTVRAAVRDVGRVFCNTDFFATADVFGEARQGLAALTAARDAGVDRFVWSSLDSAGALTGGRRPVPHWDSKAAVAAWITAQRANETMRRVEDGWFTDHVSVLTTAPYFENLLGRLRPRPGRLPDGRDGLILSLPLGTGRYPLVALDDIAFFADLLLRDWQSWGARDLAVIGDSLTGTQLAEAIETATGTPTQYADLPLDELAAAIPDVGHDYAAMAAFFQDRDLFSLDRDVSTLRKLHPHLATFADWLPQHLDELDPPAGGEGVPHP